MYTTLGPGAIGIRGSTLSSAVSLASKAGFGGVEINIREVASLVDSKGLDYVREVFANSDIRPSHWGLPVAWRDEHKWRA